MTVRVRPVDVLVTVTETPGSTACCSSLTTPSIEKVGVCADAGAQAARAMTSVANPRLQNFQGRNIAASRWMRAQYNGLSGGIRSSSPRRPRRDATATARRMPPLRAAMQRRPVGGSRPLPSRGRGWANVDVGFRRDAVLRFQLWDSERTSRSLSRSSQRRAESCAAVNIIVRIMKWSNCRFSVIKRKEVKASYYSQECSMSKTAITSLELAPPVGPFSQAIDAGGFIYFSGHVGQDPTTGKLVTGGIAAETERVFQNLSAVLKAAGKGFDDVLRAGVYLTNMSDYVALNGIYARHFSQPFPARTVIGVAALPLGACVEIDLVVKA